MNKWHIVVLFVGWGLQHCAAKEPFRPSDGTVPYIVYFKSRYRGLCVGTLVARAVVLTAAVCVVNPHGGRDARPINVVAGSAYRHMHRGIRVQVNKIIIPKLKNMAGGLGVLVEKLVAILILQRRVLDALTEVPLRSIRVDWRGEYLPAIQEDCFLAGWHFFNAGDKIYSVKKFVLQRQLRVQYVTIGNKAKWCNVLLLKLRKAFSDKGLAEYMDPAASLCVRDIDRKAQICHGSYGAPMVCRGKVVGVLTAPDAQWTNCTGFSNIVHLLSSSLLRPFMQCVSSLFVEEKMPMNWETMKSEMYADYNDDYGHVPEMYDRVYRDPDSSSEEDD